MGASSIQWTDKTCNLIAGCDPASPGCANCYAIEIARRMESGLAGPQRGKAPSARQFAVMEQYRGLTKTLVLDKGTSDERHVTKWTGKVGVNIEPLRDLLSIRGRKRVFIASMGDIFHKDTPRDLQLAVLAVAAVKPNLTFQLVTKRADVMREVFEELADRQLGSLKQAELGAPLARMLSAAAERVFGDEWKHKPARRSWAVQLSSGWQPWPLPNVHLIVSTEDQQRLDERVPLLLRCPAVVHGISAEPLLGPLDLRAYLGPAGPFLRWVIIGGESGRKARPCNVAWIRDILRQCYVARLAGVVHVAPFVKQLGAVPLGVPSCITCEGEMFEGKMCGRCGDEVEIIDGLRVLHLRDSHGGDPAEWPEDMRVQEFPPDA